MDEYMVNGGCTVKEQKTKGYMNADAVSWKEQGGKSDLLS